MNIQARSGQEGSTACPPARLDDIQRINEKLFLIATDPEYGTSSLQYLGASPSVARRLGTAPAPGVATAIRCELPLIRVTSHLEELLSLDANRWRIAGTGEGPSAVTELTLFALRCAHELAIRDAMAAKVLFGFSGIDVAEKLAGLGVWHQDALGRSARALIRIREEHDVDWWGRVLIGERCAGPKALRFARYAAQQRMDIYRSRAARTMTTKSR